MKTQHGVASNCHPLHYRDKHLMNILLLAHEKDDHAAPVEWALTQAGYHAECWGGISPDAQQQVSLRFRPEPAVVLPGLRVERGDTVWFRQPQEPCEVSRCSCWMEDIAGMLELLPARCINRRSTAKFISNKAVQLRMASESGLRVPATLMSNAPAAVRNFFDRYPDSLICKPFAPHIWEQQESNDIAVAGAFALTREQLPADEVFTYAPAIYQQRVSKQFDVRTVLMGDKVYSFALRTPGKALDWRFDGAMGKLEVEVVATPAEVENGLLRFAKTSGMCFGSADFAVDHDGRWWFLEINEQGQFLWLDHFYPQAALLQKFCAFLSAGENGAGWWEERQRLFPTVLEYEREHPGRETLSIRQADAGAEYKTVE